MRLAWRQLDAQYWDFNSRTSCEVRLHHGCAGHGHNHFNSRTSCEVRQGQWVSCEGPTRTFQLTHLLRGATRDIRYVYCVSLISTHAPLARCDRRAANSLSISRTSCEVRRVPDEWIDEVIKFQLTHLLRGATYLATLAMLPEAISTHAPLARCDTRAAGFPTAAL